MVNELLEAAARQILRDRLSAGYADRALLLVAGYETVERMNFLTEHLDALQNRSITYVEATAYGLCPAWVQRTGFRLTNPYLDSGDYGLSDPLQIAAFFASNSMMPEAQAMMVDRQRLFDSYTAARASKVSPVVNEGIYEVDYFEKVEPRVFFRTWVCPPFEDLGLVPVHRDPVGRGLDTVYCSGGHTKASVVHMMEHHLNGENVWLFSALSGRLGNRFHEELSQLAYKEVVRQGLGPTGSINYTAICRFLQLCTQPRAHEVMNDLSGVRKAAIISRYDANSEQYVEGLRALSTQFTEANRRELLRFMARTPKLDELKSVRTSGIINILDEMPWDLLEPIAREPGLRGLSLPFAERLGPQVLHRYLTNHDARVTRAPDAHREASQMAHQTIVAGNRSMADWGIVMNNLSSFYADSTRIREGMKKLVPDPYMAALMVLRCFAEGSPDIDTIVKHHPAYDKVQRLIEDWTPPIITRLWL